MARKKRNIEEAGNEWMNTYADMVTLLLTFFVLLFSMSTIEQEKFQAILDSVQKMGGVIDSTLVGGNGTGEELGSTIPGELNPNALPSGFGNLKEYIENQLIQNNLETQVEVSGNEDVVSIRFTNSLLFAPDKAVLNETSKHFLDVLGRGLKNIEGDIALIKVNGHTAEIQGGNDVTEERTLSTNRANSVLLYLDINCDLDPKKLIAVGYGKNYPIASNDTPEGMKKNRRVEVVVLRNDATLSEKDMLNLLEGMVDIE